MNDHPIRVGSMLFTMVDPEKGYEVEYNRWYERDHFYAGCMIGPKLFAGKRWVATKELKDLRFPRGDTPVASPVEAGSYLAIYYVLEGGHDEHFAWASDQVVWLYQNNRGFPNRGPCTHRAVGAPRLPLPRRRPRPGRIGVRPSLQGARGGGRRPGGRGERGAVGGASQR